MGANAQTSVPLFASGEVLTAANQNLSAGTGVPVFATTVTRDAAFGGAGEKVLAEGQLAYIEASNVVQYYDGATWATVGPVSAGFVVVKSETAFTTASSATADSIFTSTYTNYKIVCNFTTSTNAGVRLRLRSGGSSTSTATYNEQILQVASTGVTATRNASSTSVVLAPDGSNGNFPSSFEAIIYNPQVATATTVFSNFAQSNGALTTPAIALTSGNQTGSTSFDGLELFVASGTMTGTYTVYGLAKS